MIGSLIGAGLGVLGSIWGGVNASKAARKRKEQIERRLQENEDWYNREYNTDETQRASAQRVLSQLRETLRDRNRAAMGTQAVMGSTDEAVAAEKEAAGKSLADATSKIAADGEARKERIQADYRNTKSSLQDKLEGVEADRAAALSSATQGAVSAASQVGAAIDDYRDASKMASEQWDALGKQSTGEAGSGTVERDMLKKGRGREFNTPDNSASGKTPSIFDIADDAYNA